MWCRSRWRPHPHPTLEPAYSGAYRNPINMCSVHANRFNSSRTARYIRPRVFCLFLSINSGNEIRDDNPCFLKGVSMDSDIATRILFHSTGKKRFFGTPVYYWFQIKKEKKDIYTTSDIQLKLLMKFAKSRKLHVFTGTT